MGYRGRKRRLQNFWDASEQFVKRASRGLDIKTVKRSGRKLRVGNKNQRMAAKAFDIEMTLAKNQLLKEKIEKSKKKPKTFTLIYPKGRLFTDQILGVQEYFNKPNAQQIKEFVNASKHRHKAFSLTKEEYELCKSFIKNPINKGITLEKIDNALKELREWTLDSRHDTLLNEHNVLIQGINRDGTLRVTIIDV